MTITNIEKSINGFNKWLHTAEEKLGRRKIRRNYPEHTFQRDRLSGMGGFIGSWLEERMNGMEGCCLSRTGERHQPIDSSSSVNLNQCKYKDHYV